MDTNATIVQEVEKLIAETGDNPTLAKLRKSDYVAGYTSAMADVKKIIDLIKKLAGSSGT